MAGAGLIPLLAFSVVRYGQMTAGSYCYIGPQGIVHGTVVRDGVMPGIGGWEVHTLGVDSELRTPLPAAHCTECWASVPGCRGPGWESLRHLWIGRNEWRSGQSRSHRGVHWCDSRGEHARNAEAPSLPPLPFSLQSHSHSHPSFLSPPPQTSKSEFPGQHTPPAFKEPIIFHGRCLLMLSHESDLWAPLPLPH